MRKLNALFLVFLISVLSLSLNAHPHFQVFEENGSLFIRLKTKGLLDRVAQEVSQLRLGYCKDKIVVLNSQPPEFLIQFFEFFADRPDQESTPQIAQLIESHLEYTFTAPRRAELDERRASHIKLAVDMQRFPDAYTLEQKHDAAIEHQEICFLEAQFNVIETSRVQSEARGARLMRTDLNSITAELSVVASLRETTILEALEQKYRELIPQGPQFFDLWVEVLEKQHL